MLQNILIIGATGVIGTYITQAILESRSTFGRIAVLTSENTVSEKHREICALESYGVDIFVGNLDDEARVKDSYRGIHTIVSCVGRSGIEKQIPLIKWASESGIVRFYASEYGTDVEYWPSSPNEVLHQHKIKVRAYMQTVKNLEYTYLVTGPYSDLYFGPMVAHPELGSFDVKKKKAVLLGTGNEEISFTAMADVGNFVVASLLHPQASRNTTLIVHSFTATPNEILAEFERQTGCKWDVSYTSLERLRDMEYDAYQKNSSLAPIITLRRICSEGGTLYKYYDEMLLEAATEGLEEQVKLNIEKQMEDVYNKQNPFRRLSTF